MRGPSSYLSAKRAMTTSKSRRIPSTNDKAMSYIVPVEDDSPEVLVRRILTVSPPVSGPREAILLRRLQALDPAVTDVQVQEFYLINVLHRKTETLDLTESVIEGISNVLREAAVPGKKASDEPVSGTTASHHSQFRAYAPRPFFQSVWSSNVRAILKGRGSFADFFENNEGSLQDLEAGRWYRISSRSEALLPQAEALLHDHMTETLFIMPHSAAWGDTGKTWTLPTVDAVPAAARGESATRTLSLRVEGARALQDVSDKYGMGLGPWEKTFLTDLFVSKIGRDPTEIEIFDVAQSLSEHCRHWTFDGQLVVNGEVVPKSLMQMVKEPLQRLQEQTQAEGKAEDNSLVAFSDNSSVIKGPRVRDFQPARPDRPSPYACVEGVRHLSLTAETHNFPCSIAPFPGAQTGVGGRIRDILATGRGGYTLAGLAGYAVGELSPGSAEDSAARVQNRHRRPAHVAAALDILLRASDGASDYANKYGEPLVAGFARAMPAWRGAEFLKPIMFSAGLGKVPAEALLKRSPSVGMAVVKLGGPAYRVGLGGGAASSKVGGDPELDLQAVQRGDPEMGNKVGRVVRACVEMQHASNSLVLESVHDQGAGGNANVLKELVAPAGADVFLDRIERGDSSLTPLEVWGAEYQESQGLLVNGSQALAALNRICRRESAPMAVVGHVTGNGAIRVFESEEQSGDGQAVQALVDLPLEPLLSHRPKRVIEATRERTGAQSSNADVEAGEGIGGRRGREGDKTALRDTLYKVLNVVSVGSKAFLTNKVDRSVTGLVAAQPCVGPLHLPVGDVGVTALSFWGVDGVATALGECPGIGIAGGNEGISAMVRMAVGEALTNLVSAPLTGWADIKLQANWMWPGREGASAGQLYDGVEALRGVLLELGLALDGGKDSLSMATLCEDGIRVPSPATVVVTAYAPCCDVSRVLTPDVKVPGECDGQEGVLLFLDVSGSGPRPKELGGSAWAEIKRIDGDQRTPDMRDPALLRRAFEAVQGLSKKGKIQACHDVSSGGLVTTVLEMAISGDAGARLVLPAGDPHDPLLSSQRFTEASLFSEELGLVLELKGQDLALVQNDLQDQGIPYSTIGFSTPERKVEIRGADGRILLSEETEALHAKWCAMSLQLERLQASPACIEAEEAVLSSLRRPVWAIPPSLTTARPSPPTPNRTRLRVGVLREQGSNGDREMAAALHSAGFQVWDLTVADLLQGQVDLGSFHGLAFVGGFSYGDALGSARGWRSVLLGNPRVEAQLRHFFARPETWSLGLCNGCQLLVALGIVPDLALEDRPNSINCKKPLVWLGENDSGRFESRFVTVKVGPSPAVLLKGLEGLVMGIWSAHAEGKMHFSDESLMNQILDRGLAPVRYTDPWDRGGERGGTEQYPFNPNGSPRGVAALCSADGRHLAMMPHPERSWLRWQMPWMAQAGYDSAKSPSGKVNAGHEEVYTPWFRLFQNAFHFSVKMFGNDVS